MKQRGVFSLLALSTIGSLTIATGSVLVLGPEDKISVPRGVLLLFLGFIFFLSLFDFLNHVALKTNSGLKIRKKYQLTMFDVLDISNKVVSAVQAALSCVTGAIVCLWSCTRNFLHSSHFMSEAYAWFGAAYFFYDIWSMYKVHINMPNMGLSSKNDAAKGKGLPKNNQDETIQHDQINETEKNGASILELQNSSNFKNRNSSIDVVISFLSYCKDQPIIVMHHLFIGGFGFLVIVYLRGGLGDCVFGFVYLMELSTPFVSLRSILSRLKMKSTQLYVVNGIAMLVTFFVCRILIMPYLCFVYSRTIGLPYWEAIQGLPTGCKISISILLFPQVYWFYLMMIGATKVFCPRNTKSNFALAADASSTKVSASHKAPLDTNQNR
ncbi:ceramide synthase [Arctopsyche grandis]|uniref:ceramide synthase n=1 Tax=Arctopsyche grandis TaxID=121162 RepID=UPI00406D909B